MNHLSHSTCWRLTYSNTTVEQMEMTTPVFTRKGEPSGKKMDMAAPVITKKSADKNQWKMSFVMPSKYGSDLPLPKDPSVTIKEVPSKIVAVAAFSDAANLGYPLGNDSTIWPSGGWPWKTPNSLEAVNGANSVFPPLTNEQTFQPQELEQLLQSLQDH